MNLERPLKLICMAIIIVSMFGLASRLYEIQMVLEGIRADMHVSATAAQEKS